MCIEISYFCDAAILNSTDFMFLCTLVCVYTNAYMHRCMLVKRRDALNEKKKKKKKSGKTNKE